MLDLFELAKQGLSPETDKEVAIQKEYEAVDAELLQVRTRLVLRHP